MRRNVRHTQRRPTLPDDLPTLERWTDLAFSGTDLDKLFEE